jgi:hypothetical protein
MKETKMRTKMKTMNTNSSLKPKSVKGFRKASGTRAGTLQDWREGSGKNSKGSSQRRHTLRDGR